MKVELKYKRYLWMTIDGIRVETFTKGTINPEGYGSFIGWIDTEWTTINITFDVKEKK